jgi:hypothetical protein
VQSLAHFGATVADEHGTVNVNVHQSTSLIQEFSREGDAVFSRQNANALLLVPVFPEFCIRKVLKQSGILSYLLNLSTSCLRA